MKKRFYQANALSSVATVSIHVVIATFALLCLIPFILVLVVSFTSEDSIRENGYQFIPSEFSLEAYRYIFRSGDQIARSYIVSISMTALGTALAMLSMLMCAYALSRPEFSFRRHVSFFVLVTLLFNAGLVPFYLVVTQVFRLRDTFMVLVLATLINPFYLLVLRSFLQSNVPHAIIESGRLEGANEFQILFLLVAPIAKPSIATIAFFTMIAYWNNWYTGLLFIINPRLTPLPNLLIRIEQNIEFLIRNSSVVGSANLLALIRELPTQTIIFATLLITTGPILLVFPFFQRYLVRGLTIGSLKG